jgi:hypothetical protein
MLLGVLPVPVLGRGMLVDVAAVLPAMTRAIVGIYVASLPFELHGPPLLLACPVLVTLRLQLRLAGSLGTDLGLFAMLLCPLSALLNAAGLRLSCRDPRDEAHHQDGNDDDDDYQPDRHWFTSLP